VLCTNFTKAHSLFVKTKLVKLVLILIRIYIYIYIYIYNAITVSPQPVEEAVDRKPLLLVKKEEEEAKQEPMETEEKKPVAVKVEAKEEEGGGASNGTTQNRKKSKSLAHFGHFSSFKATISNNHEFLLITDPCGQYVNCSLLEYLRAFRALECWRAPWVETITIIN